MKIVFLDRDGVINAFPGDGKYVTRVKDFHLLSRSQEAIKLLTEAGFAIFVISNQAGVGKGVYSREKLKQITRKFVQEIKASGGRLAGVYYCTHRSTAGCDCRKPEIGNIRKALDSIGKTVRAAKGAFFVGDTKSDIFAGYNAKCKTILVLSGRAQRSEARSWGIKPDFIAKDLLAALPIILGDREPALNRVREHERYLKKNHIRMRTRVRYNTV
ncbi:MAG: HAD-IIIA family hydrolase [Candidatus Omnitrophica bacterium]|nr:HAD-IIIA family hydrolase [Candidatus Omnitrophota bacterium]